MIHPHGRDLLVVLIADVEVADRRRRAVREARARRLERVERRRRLGADRGDDRVLAHAGGVEHESGEADVDARIEAQVAVARLHVRDRVEDRAAHLDIHVRRDGVHVLDEHALLDAHAAALDDDDDAGGLVGRLRFRGGRVERVLDRHETVGRDAVDREQHVADLEFLVGRPARQHLVDHEQTVRGRALAPHSLLRLRRESEAADLVVRLVAKHGAEASARHDRPGRRAGHLRRALRPEPFELPQALERRHDAVERKVEG